MGRKKSRSSLKFQSLLVGVEEFLPVAGVQAVVGMFRGILRRLLVEVPLQTLLELYHERHGLPVIHAVLKAWYSRPMHENASVAGEVLPKNAPSDWVLPN